MADDINRDVPSRYSAGVRPQGGDRFFDANTFDRVAWGAIWAGVMVTIGMEALFLAFGVFINAIFGGSFIWVAAWYLVTMAISFYAGAASTSRLAHVSTQESGALHGLTTWGLATLSDVVIFGLAAAVIGWAALTRSTAPLSQVNVWGGATIEYAGIFWGGIMLSLMTAYLGGRTAHPAIGETAGQENAPSAPMRRVS
jgi:hypothetical protein